jgi:hypothetical protein
MPIRKLALAVIAVAALLAATACTVNKQGKGNEENVQIRTPVGGINVNTDVNAQDVGLAVYPGAKLNPKPKGEHSSANVNISSSLFGVKVVALDYVSDDPPAKLIDFYKKEMGKYGNVLECKNGIHEHDDELKCEDKPHPGDDKMELAVGTKERQHIVSVKPNGSGSQFALVYVQTHGKEGQL